MSHAWRSTNARPDLEELVPPGAEAVLDVGCGRGILGEALKMRGARRVVGVEIDPELAEEARGRLDDVLIADAGASLPLPEGTFDCIVYGDVLEHLVDPWAALRAHRPLLRPGGVVVVSIPNIAHWLVVRDLVRGRWEYRDFGTMDATHLRFFTRRGIEQLLDQAGYRIEQVVTPISAGGKAWWINRFTRARLEHLLVWRYVVVARAA